MYEIWEERLNLTGKSNFYYTRKWNMLGLKEVSFGNKSVVIFYCSGYSEIYFKIKINN